MNFLRILKPLDIVIVVLLLSMAGLLTLNGIKSRSEKYVVITKDSINKGEFPLNKDRLIELENNIVVEIKDSKVRVKTSPCRNQICVKQGWSDSQPIICAPQKLSVTIKSADSEKEMLISR